MKSAQALLKKIQLTEQAKRETDEALLKLLDEGRKRNAARRARAEADPTTQGPLAKCERELLPRDYERDTSIRGIGAIMVEAWETVEMTLKT